MVNLILFSPSLISSTSFASLTSFVFSSLLFLAFILEQWTSIDPLKLSIVFNLVSFVLFHFIYVRICFCLSRNEVDDQELVVLLVCFCSVLLRGNGKLSIMRLFFFYTWQYVKWPVTVLINQFISIRSDIIEFDLFFIVFLFIVEFFKLKWKQYNMRLSTNRLSWSNRMKLIEQIKHSTEVENKWWREKIETNRKSVRDETNQIKKRFWKLEMEITKWNH